LCSVIIFPFHSSGFGGSWLRPSGEADFLFQFFFGHYLKKNEQLPALKKGGAPLLGLAKSIYYQLSNGN